MSKYKGCVFESRVYRGETEPPASLEDMSRYGNNGVITGATWIRRSSGIWVLSSDGVDDFIDLRVGGVVAPSLDFADGETWTVSVWLNHTSSQPDDHGILVGSNSYHGILVRSSGTDQYRFRAQSNNYFTWLASSAAYTDKYTNLVYRCDGADIELFINGVYGYSITPDTTALECLTILWSVGTADSYVKGTSGEYRIYNYTLSAAQIYKIFQSERSLFGV